MPNQGTIIRWDAARGFGFIRSPDTAADLFFHVRDFRGAEPPREGLRVVFEGIHRGGKGPRAMAVRVAGGADGHEATLRRDSSAASAPSSTARADSAPGARLSSPARQRDVRDPSHQTASRTALRERPRRTTRPSTNHPAAAGTVLLLTLLWLGLLAWGIVAGRLPLGWTLGAGLALNVVTYVAYAIDKNAAVQGHWRMAEKHLHLLSLAGGWPGAWLAQQSLRHKSQKAAFRLGYWGTVVLHNAALAAWVTGLIQMP